jgi:hypothetical protein
LSIAPAGWPALGRPRDEFPAKAAELRYAVPAPWPVGPALPQRQDPPARGWSRRLCPRWLLTRAAAQCRIRLRRAVRRR